MAKFQKPNQYHKPSETAVNQPGENPEVPRNSEMAIAQPAEAPAGKPKQVCGINGCMTWYDDTVVMKRHRERQHGLGAENLNKPRPRNAEIKLA
jgi:hypothetical protein